MKSQSYFLNWRVPNPRSGRNYTLTYSDYLKGVKSDEEAMIKAREKFATILVSNPDAKFLKLIKKVTRTKVLCRKLT